MNQIEHDPDEPKIDRQNYGWLYRRALILVAVFWLLRLYVGGPFIWSEIMLGAATAGILTLVLVEYSRDQ
ncbi:hypothetical protein CN878_16685 [Ochrobactrum sp. 695/2009]|nr:hypothetical protein CN881_19600 [Ochrobactrum sp. 721/2009]PJT16743.1 hypothetical protein CN880_10465 [Ochrobactrum sp. 720/2009]PJT26565.1 hypothetical protein CN879_06430 [Ochrobactrum sp. 715/2009]PJT28619.1 hypothetical protein CN878_16685 [Ochrobactrum sp. 695/2009]PJT36085.1 hypothetical protein CN877_08875 [Ochrobactrum sp. 689/2009]